jgi:hypothetical protein
MIGTITEDISVSEYDDEDFLEVFVTEFRPWIKKNHGDEIGEYPMSLLIKKYIKEFVNDYGIDESILRYTNTLNSMIRVGRSLAEKEVRKLPSLKKDIMFTEKFKKVIDHFISNYNLPDFAEIHIHEESPFQVRGWINLDFEPAMKYDGNLNELSTFQKEFTHLITQYLGFEIGSTIHGKLDFYFEPYFRFGGVDEWVKNVLNKKIKKDIKSLPNKSAVRSIKFSLNNTYVEGIITLSYDRSSHYQSRNSFENEFREYLNNLGYNPNRLLIK